MRFISGGRIPEALSMFPLIDLRPLNASCSMYGSKSWIASALAISSFLQEIHACSVCYHITNSNFRGVLDHEVEMNGAVKSNMCKDHHYSSDIQLLSFQKGFFHLVKVIIFLQEYAAQVNCNVYLEPWETFNTYKADGTPSNAQEIEERSVQSLTEGKYQRHIGLSWNESSDSSLSSYHFFFFPQEHLNYLTSWKFMHYETPDQSILFLLYVFVFFLSNLSFYQRILRTL